MQLEAREAALPVMERAWKDTMDFLDKPWKMVVEWDVTSGLMGKPSLSWDLPICPTIRNDLGLSEIPVGDLTTLTHQS